MHCYNCGKRIKDEWKYCKYCGAKLLMPMDDNSESKLDNKSKNIETEILQKPAEKPVKKITPPETGILKKPVEKPVKKTTPQETEILQKPVEKPAKKTTPQETEIFQKPVEKPVKKTTPQETENPQKSVDRSIGNKAVDYSFVVTLIGIAGLCCYFIAFFMPTVKVLWRSLSLYQMYALLQEEIQSGTNNIEILSFLGPVTCVFCQLGGVGGRSQAGYWIAGLTGAAYAIYLVWLINDPEARNMTGFDIGFAIWLIAVFLSISAALVINMMGKTNSVSRDKQTE